MSKLSACLDSNVYISAIAFGGKPLRVLDRALSRDFHLVCGPNIVEEVRKNLVGKLGLQAKRVDQFLADIAAVASVFVPTGKVRWIKHREDNAILELAIMAGCDVLVTGDKRHLLPLGKIQSMVIEPPSRFLERLDRA